MCLFRGQASAYTLLIMVSEVKVQNLPNLTCPAVSGSAGSILRWQRLIQYSSMGGRALFATRQWGSNSKPSLSENVVWLSLNIEHFDSCCCLILPLPKRCHRPAIRHRLSSYAYHFASVFRIPWLTTRDVAGTHIRHAYLASEQLRPWLYRGHYGQTTTLS